jgi:hypothetical protein
MTLVELTARRRTLARRSTATSVRSRASARSKPSSISGWRSRPIPGNVMGNLMTPTRTLTRFQIRSRASLDALHTAVVTTSARCRSRAARARGVGRPIRKYLDGLSPVRRAGHGR